jgi:hypothetical protein
MKIDGMEVQEVSREEAERWTHDEPGPPSRDQEQDYLRQREKEEEEALPFTDEDA